MARGISRPDWPQMRVSSIEPDGRLVKASVVRAFRFRQRDGTLVVVVPGQQLELPKWQAVELVDSFKVKML